MDWLIWIVPQAIAGAAIWQLVLHPIYYTVIMLLFLIISYYRFKHWMHQYRTHAIIALKQRVFSNPLLWEITFKNSHTQSIELLHYYRTIFVTIIIYRPLHQTRISSYVLFKDAFSSLHYQQLVRALWAK